jgi:hypothetical protein
MENKKSLLQDSLQELENIKNESLELAKEQLINESADLLEKKSAALFEKLISEGAEEEKTDDKEEKPSDKKEDDDEGEDLEEPSKDDEEEDDEDEEEGDEEDKEEEDDEDITFDDEEGDEKDFMSVKVDEKVIAESKFRNTKNMKNNKKEVLKDLRDVSFNKLVEAYYNMDESDSFVVKEDYNMEEDYYEEDYMEENYPEDEENPILKKFDNEFAQRMKGSKEYKPTSREKQYFDEPKKEYEPYADVRKGGDDYGDEEIDEEIMYEIDIPEEGYQLTDEEINEMLSEMDLDEEVPSSEQGAAYRTQEKHRHFKGDIHNYHTDELEEAFSEMTMEELMEMESILEDDGVEESKYMEEDAVIDEMLYSEKDEDQVEESMSTEISLQNQKAMPKRVRGLEEGEYQMKEMSTLHEKVKELEKQNAKLQEGFVNKIKLLENKVYDVTISALKAGFVNKFLLENPLRENEKTEIVYRFANAQTKEQIKETYISLTNEFAKRQIVKDGSMLNESVQNKVGKVHRTDNAIVREKNLINENDESNRFKQLLNYNFGKK